MDIEIDYKKLIDSPISKNDSHIDILSDEIQQFKKDLKKSNSSSYLISGYRGVGKTSFIKQLVDNDENKYLLLNISKYQTHDLILRKLIRALYLEFKNTNKIIENELENLFIRTFSDVKNIKTKTNNKSKKTIISFDINTKNIISIILVLLSSINLKFKFLEKLIEPVLDFIFFIVSTGFLIISNLKINKSITKESKEENCLKISDFYDNDIAEFQLTRVLGLIRDKGYKLSIIIDEFDKIEDENNIKLVINELKPIMLSGLCNFIIIAGQKTYYNFSKAQYIDDSIISTLFSKTIHIPLFSNEDFHSLFRSYLVDIQKINNTRVIEYINELILTSYRLPRKFIHQLKQSTYWEEDKLLLKLDSTPHNLNTKLVSIIDKIENNQLLNNNFSEAQKDFFIVQLHIWAISMKERESSFKKGDIYEECNYEESKIPINGHDVLHVIFEHLITEMVNEKLITIHSKLVDNKSVIVYKWDLKVKSNNENQSIIVNYLSKYNDYENLLSGFYNEMFNLNESIQHRRSLKYLLNELKVKVQLTNLDDKNIDKIIETQRKLISNDFDSEIKLDSIQESSFILDKYRNSLYEDYTFYHVSKELNNSSYNLSRFNLDKFDFIAQNNESKIYFEVTINNRNSKYLYNIHKKIKNMFYNSTEKKYFIIIVYTSVTDQNKKRISYDRITRDLEIKDYVYIKFIPREYSTTTISELQKFLTETIAGINANEVFS